MNGQENTNTARLPRWDADLLGKRFIVTGERPALTPHARKHELRENLKHKPSFSNPYSRFQQRPEAQDKAS